MEKVLVLHPQLGIRNQIALGNTYQVLHAGTTEEADAILARESVAGIIASDMINQSSSGLPWVEQIMAGSTPFGGPIVGVSSKIDVQLAFEELGCRASNNPMMAAHLMDVLLATM